jgi:hypothetical protein
LFNRRLDPGEHHRIVGQGMPYGTIRWSNAFDAAGRRTAKRRYANSVRNPGVGADRRRAIAAFEQFGASGRPLIVTLNAPCLMR